MNIKKINKRTSDGEHFAKLAEMGEVVFHSDDLANLWGITNKNSLYITISRYVKRGLLFRIYNGLYSIKKADDLNSYFLGLKVLHRPAYISCEIVLYDNGVINQRPQIITLVSSISKSFSVGKNRYRSRQMRDQYLFNDIGIEVVNGVRKATLARAVADMLYFNKDKYFDIGQSKMIDWLAVKKIAHNVGYKIKI